MITIIYFSPTGNVKYIAGKLSEKLGSDNTNLLPLEFIDHSELEPTDKLVILYSVHAFNPPKTVNRFIKNLPEGLYKSVSLIAVGCADIWINYAASSDLKKTLEKKGYSVTLSETLAMPLTLIMQFPVDVGRDTVINAEKKLDNISKLIISAKLIEKDVPFKSKVLHAVGKAEGPAAKLFGLELYANRDCTSCGICVKNCPEKNIVFNRKEIPKFKFNCIMCLRCIYECPVNAIKPRISRFIPIKNSYNLSKYLP